MRDYKHEYQSYQGRPEQIHNRSLRNTARRMLVKAGVNVSGRDVGHRVGLMEGGSNSRSNLRAESIHENRARK